VAKHSKPIDFSDGAYYRMLNEAHIYPLLEYRCLRRRYRAQSGFCDI